MEGEAWSQVGQKAGLSGAGSEVRGFAVRSQTQALMKRAARGSGERVGDRDLGEC